MINQPGLTPWRGRQVQADQVREHYLDAIRRYQDALRIGCTNCFATYHLVDTRKPVQEVLLIKVRAV